MSAKHSSGKVMPMLSIVFFSISLVLFAAKGIWSIIYRLVIGGAGSVAHVLLAESGKVAAFAFPAVFFIIFAALYLKRKQSSKGLFCVCMAAQAVSCLALSARLVQVHRLLDWQNASRSIYPLAVLFALVAVLCVIAAILEAKGKSRRAVMIVAAAAGLLIAVYMFSLNVFNFILGFSYYRNHLFLMSNAILGALLYLVGISFYYIAFIFAALFKKHVTTEHEKVKVKIKA